MRARVVVPILLVLGATLGACDRTTGPSGGSGGPAQTGRYYELKTVDGATLPAEMIAGTGLIASAGTLGFGSDSATFALNFSGIGTVATIVPYVRVGTKVIFMYPDQIPDTGTVSDASITLPAKYVDSQGDLKAVVLVFKEAQ